MSNIINIHNLGEIAKGLNIEGHRPYNLLPTKCKWYNIIQVIDEPLKGETFDKIMGIVKTNNYNYIEQAVDIDINILIADLVCLIKTIKKYHNNLLVHIHQYKNTTRLAEMLEKKTGVKCILDNTNFFKSPVNYKTCYPDIDGLLSISQCAGFNLSPGSWILPESYMTFDVKNSIIYKDKIQVCNSIKPFINFEYVEGDILVVDDLWNPSIENDETYLLLDKQDTLVLNFVKKNTKTFDKSHNWCHAVKVARNALQILDKKAVLYLALLHDVCDHKYHQALSRVELTQWIQNNLESYKYVDKLIDHVSFSKQISMKKVDPILEAVRDGDRLEAIGEVGINRCIEYVKSKGGIIPDDVIQHCFDKLLKIVPYGYIVNKTKEAKRRHNVIVDYVILNCKDLRVSQLAYLL